MSELLELAERCEKAAGPDRGLDGAIWAAIQGVELLIFECPPSSGEVLSYRGTLKYPDVPGVARFTGSIDAAMALVSGRCFPTLDRFVIGDTSDADVWRVWIKTPIEIGDKDFLGKVFAKAQTPALALCAAALRARTGPLP